MRSRNDGAFSQPAAKPVQYPFHIFVNFTLNKQANKCGFRRPHSRTGLRLIVRHFVPALLAKAVNFEPVAQNSVIPRQIQLIVHRAIFERFRLLAIRANEVMMVMVQAGSLEFQPALQKVKLLQHAHFAQHAQIAVDGIEADARIFDRELVVNVLGRQVTVGRGKNLRQRPALLRNAPPVARHDPDHFPDFVAAVLAVVRMIAIVAVVPVLFGHRYPFFPRLGASLQADDRFTLRKIYYLIIAQGGKPVNKPRRPSPIDGSGMPTGFAFFPYSVP
jgi:hypothetical protein